MNVAALLFCTAFIPRMTEPTAVASKLAEHPVACPPHWMPVLVASKEVRTKQQELVLAELKDLSQSSEFRVELAAAAARDKDQAAPREPRLFARLHQVAASNSSWARQPANKEKLVRIIRQFNRSLLSRPNTVHFAAPPPDSLGVQLGASDKGLHTASGDFDVTMGVECKRGSYELINETSIKSVRRCREACAAQVECVAAELDQVLGKCTLWRECLWRGPAMRVLRGVGHGHANKVDPRNESIRALFGFDRERAGSGVRVMHRVGREWPVPARQVVWRANATIVVASYTSRLDWLRTIPDAFDVALYHKHDFVANASRRARTMSDERLPLHFMRNRQLCNAVSTKSPRVGLPLEPCPPNRCICSTKPEGDHRLAYYRILPNYGRTEGQVRGGSREPYPYLRFILDFWDNLPNVLIFSQDDIMKGHWIHRVPQSIAMLRDWRQHWGEPRRPTRDNCMCNIIAEHQYGPRGYYWYGWMSLLQENIFNQTMATRPHNKTVVWAQSSEFAVGAATVLATPRWVYQLLLKLVVSEEWCFGGSIHWAHSLERMWLEILDPRVPKMKTWLSARQPLGMWQKCFATALEGDPKSEDPPHRWKYRRS